MSVDLKVGLIKGRHELPVCDYIYENEIENPMDFEALFRVANRRVIELVGAEGEDFDICEDEIHLFVTGLTQATIAVINACMYNKVHVALYHFNRETGVYLRQDIQGVSLTRYSIDEALKIPSPTFGRGNTELLYSDPELIIKEDEGDDE